MFTVKRIWFVTRFVVVLTLITEILGTSPVTSVRAATITVTNTSDSGAGSLRQAIADAVSGDTITFDPSLGSYSIINLFSSLVIDKDLIIDASSLTNPLSVDFRNSSNLQVLNSTVTISNLIFQRGYSSGNGGAIWSNGSLTLRNMTIKDSHANGNGGAIYTEGPLTLQNVALYGNESGQNGAGIFAETPGDEILIANTTISKNLAYADGGGLYLAGNSIAKLFNSTLFQNGGYVTNEIVSRNASELMLYNTIVSCSSNGNCTDLYEPPQMFNSVLAFPGENYGLESLADNGGPTKTVAILPSSPLVDAGDNSICANQLVNNVDQRGVIRPFGSNCDIGAYELQYFTISGNVGVGGAVLKYRYGLFTMADDNGNYSIKVLPGWSGTVIPVKQGYSFSPAKKDYMDVRNDQTGQNYTAIANTYTPSGNSGDTWRVSVTSNGIQADDDSYNPVISANGRYVAYWSFAWNLVPGNGATDIVVHDNQTGETYPASVDSDGFPLSENSHNPSISADGRYIAFTSIINGSLPVVFIYDRDTRTAKSEARGTYASISADGRYLAYLYYDNPGQIFIQNLWTQDDTQVSVSTTGGDANGYSSSPSVSSDGRYIAFQSDASDLVGDDTNGVTDIFIRDVQDNITTRVSIDSAGTQANSDSFHPSISGDGRYVTFYSSATNLVVNDMNEVEDVFVHDLETGITTRISVNSNGVEGNGVSDIAHITSNGRYIAFRSSATNLIDGDTNDSADIFLYNRDTGDIRRVSTDSNGAQANGDSSSLYSGGFGISEDGKYLAFSSDATNLVNGDTNGYSDIFVRGLPAKVHHVKWNATGLNDGSSWTDAYTDLQAALSTASSGDEIWVAAGTYKPTSSTDRTNSFALKNGVAIYGGFAGTETLRTQRNPATNVTILSGEIGAAGIADNSYHVVIGSGTNSTAVLDGFTITAGYADDLDIDHGGGGGMFISNGNPALTNLIFSANTALHGGGLFNDNSSPTLAHVTFDSNTSSYSDGGGMYNYMSSPTLTDMIFSNNSAAWAGGGMINDGAASPSVTNVTFINNSAKFGGAISNFDGGSPTLTNVTFDSNTANNNGGGMYNSNGNPTLTNVTFSNNSASLGGGMYNFYTSPTLTNVIIANSASGGDCVNNLSTLNAASANNLIEDAANACGLTNSVSGNIIGSDPLLGTLGDYGGSTQTLPLLPGSLAINAGTDSVSICDSNASDNFDQRGVTRPQGSHCDIGAYEYETSSFAPTASQWTGAFSYNAGWRVDQHPRMLADVNGDGKADAVGFGYAGVYVALANAAGTAFAPTASLWTGAFSYNAGWRVDQHPRLLADVNGDGKADAVGFGYAGVYVALAHAS
ncbi:MAG TPA: choice-of-anchor Q domain-containing protein, partial [Anaerolineales bacterium]|nr:choice-of-anchor Q domain-containing protein [Anaerolineales bacterium]